MLLYCFVFVWRDFILNRVRRDISENMHRNWLLFQYELRDVYNLVAVKENQSEQQRWFRFDNDKL